MEELIKALKGLLPDFTREQLRQVIKMLGLEDAVLVTSVEEVEEGSTVKSVTIAEMAAQLKGLGYGVKLPGIPEREESTQKSMRPGYNTNPIRTGTDPAEGEEDDDQAEAQRHKKAIGAAYAARFGGADDDSQRATRKAILEDVVGNEYVQTVYEQNLAFAKFVRFGETRLDAKETKLMHQMIFPEDQIIKAIVDGGLDVRTLKATQVEAIGELGGFVIPPNRQSEIDTRLPGLTAVRGSGARVITLVNSNSTEIPQWRGDSKRYIGLMRGQRGTETQAPTEQNFKLDMVPVVAYIYTYKVPMSMSMVEDASNVVPMLMNDIAITRAMDEDEEFLVGDGVGKAEGILPGGVNLHALREVVTGDSDELTVTGIKALKRGVPTQYRPSCVWVGNSDTYGLIELMTVSTASSTFAFPDLSEEDMLLARRIYESEVMPDVAADALPLIFGDMSGYTIVERLGQSIERFHDSGTGINKVEFQVRARFGGRLEKPWPFAVQKVHTGDPFSG